MGSDQKDFERLLKGWGENYAILDTKFKLTPYAPGGILRGLFRSNSP